MSRRTNLNFSTYCIHLQRVLGCLVIGRLSNRIRQPGASILVVEYPSRDRDRFILPSFRPFIVLEVLGLEARMKNL